MTETGSSFRRVPPEDLAWLGTGPVPAKPYYDPAYFELERQAVFLKSWIQIGHVCEFPVAGSFVRRDLEFAKASLLVVRGRDDQLRAFHNVCTHRGTQLVDEAAGRRSTFSCPYHRWTYGTDGALLSRPGFRGLWPQQGRLRASASDARYLRRPDIRDLRSRSLAAARMAG